MVLAGKVFLVRENYDMDLLAEKLRSFKIESETSVEVSESERKWVRWRINSGSSVGVMVEPGSDGCERVRGELTEREEREAVVHVGVRVARELRRRTSLPKADARRDIPTARTAPTEQPESERAYLVDKLSRKPEDGVGGEGAKEG